MVTIQGLTIPLSAVSINRNENHTLEIDVEKCWNEMGLQPGWSNEVEVKVYFSVDH
jgi:hypothetical protein